MALTVTTAKPQGYLNVVNNYGMQGSTYNPQQTAPVGVVQPAASANYYQPAATSRYVQPAATSRTIQPAISSAEVVRIAQERRLAVEREAARQREVIRQQVQLKVDTAVAAKTAELKVRAAQALPRSLGFSKITTPKIKLPEQSEYDKTYASAYNEAMTEFDRMRSGTPKRGLSGVWDKLVGHNFREIDARTFAEKRARDIMDRDFPAYETRINDYIKLQAAAQARINKAASSVSTQAEYDGLVSSEQAALDTEFKRLESDGARYQAMTDAFGKSSQRPLSGFLAKTLSKAVQLAASETPIWRYTLGQGSANIPSLVTAPNRALNFFANLNTKDRTIYTEDGGSFSRDGSNKNAWQSTLNQRTLNSRPWVDVGRGSQADAILGDEVRSLIAARKKNGETDPNKLDYNRVMDERLGSYNRSHRGFNSVLSVAADPLNFVGGGIGLAARTITKSVTSTKFISRLANSSFVRKLTADVVSPGERFITTTEKIRDDSRALQQRLLDQIGTRSKGVSNYDISVLDDLQHLTPSELEVFQRMNNGKLAFRDRVRLAGRNYAPARARLEQVASKYQDFVTKQGLIDDVNLKTSRFGKGKPTYSPRTVWADDLDEYDFRLFKRRTRIQSGEDFLHGVADRFFRSNYDQHFADLKPLFSEYSKSFTNSKAAYGAARSEYRRDSTTVRRWIRNKNGVRSDVSFGRATLNTAKSLPGAPTRFWKQSVLKYRPAWYANNALYNVQAATLAGGFRALYEHGRLLLPGRFNRALDDVPHDVRTKLASEIGQGRLSRFATRVENWSRVAAYRGARFQGYTPDQAVKRVDKYLFRYTTKNYERPIKSVVPFWTFQKNLARAAATLPFDKPAAAIAYNRFDGMQQKQFDDEFNTTVPELRKLGFSDAEIDQMRNEQSKYYRGRLKVGDRYINTPFNAFSEKQMSQFGINPWLSVARETIDSTDNFGRPVSGRESSLWRRVLSKFPQAELSLQGFRTLQVNRGQLKPTDRYIGEAGSEGYGLGKEKQGYDSKKSNYVESLDPRRKLGQNLLAFVGVPRSTSFDAAGFVQSKRLQRVTGEYFATDWRALPFDDQQKAQNALFTRYGMTPDDFFKGVLSKYDTESTTRIKGMKEDARAKNQFLLDEYARQPFGTRSMWAANKMHELADSGYFGENPFLFSFAKGANTNPASGWLTPSSIAKVRAGAQKKADYEYSNRTGDWSKWRKKYASKPVKKSSPFQLDGKYFKSAESLDRFKQGKAKHAESDFWRGYHDADKPTRKKLLAENPQYNTRANWTREDWDRWKVENRRSERERIMGFRNFGEIVKSNINENLAQAARFQSSRGNGKKRIAFRLR